MLGEKKVQLELPPAAVLIVDGCSKFLRPSFSLSFSTKSRLSNCYMWLSQVEFENHAGEEFFELALWPWEASEARSFEL